MTKYCRYIYTYIWYANNISTNHIYAQISQVNGQYKAILQVFAIYMHWHTCIDIYALIYSIMCIHIQILIHVYLLPIDKSHCSHQVPIPVTIVKHRNQQYRTQTTNNSTLTYTYTRKNKSEFTNKYTYTNTLIIHITISQID